MFDLIPTEILISSVIVMPTSRFEALESELSHINNLPSFLDITESIDPIRNSSQRKHPHLSFIHIKEPHDSYVYDGNDDNEMVDLGDLIVPFIEKGTTFKLQLMVFDYNGVDYSEQSYNDQGMISETRLFSEELPDIYQP